MRLANIHARRERERERNSGPCLDNLHGGFGVLSYAKFELALGCGLAPEWWGGGCALNTALWVSPLFAVAAVVIGTLSQVLEPVLDGGGNVHDAAQARQPPPPSGALVAGSVALFALHYLLSAALAAAPLARPRQPYRLCVPRACWSVTHRALHL